MSNYWLQKKAPAGNWVDSVGAEEEHNLIEYGVDSLNKGIPARVVERTDIEVWPENKLDHAGERFLTLPGAGEGDNQSKMIVAMLSIDALLTATEDCGSLHPSVRLLAFANREHLNMLMGESLRIAAVNRRIRKGA